MTVEKFALSPDHVFIWIRGVIEGKVPAKLDKEWYVNLAISRISDKFGIEVRE